MIPMPAGRAAALWATSSDRTVFHNEGGKDEPAAGDEVPAAARSAREVREQLDR